MSLVDDGGETPLSEEEVQAVRKNAELRLRLWRTRSVYSLAGLFLACVAVAPFLAGHSLHSYWNSVGKYLVLVSMGLLVVALYCVGLCWGAWSAMRQLEDRRKE
jgi:hypothetical protein